MYIAIMAFWEALDSLGQSTTTMPKTPLTTVAISELGCRTTMIDAQNNSSTSERPD
jgi:hypothetical protein